MQRCCRQVGHSNRGLSQAHALADQYKQYAKLVRAIQVMYINILDLRPRGNKNGHGKEHGSQIGEIKLLQLRL